MPDPIGLTLETSDHRRDDTAAREQARALTFLRIGSPAAALAAIGNLVIGLKSGQWIYIVASAFPGISAFVMLVGMRWVREGRIAPAMLLFSRTAIVACSLNALVFPDQFPAFELVVILSIIVVLPYVQGEELKRFLRFAMPFGILMPLACLWLPLPHPGKPIEHQAMMSVVLVPVFCIAIVLIVQFAERLREMVTKLVRSNQALDAAEIALREEASQLRATLDSRRDAVLTVDTEESVTYFNAAARELLGLDAEVAKKTKIFDLITLVFSREDESIANIVAAARRYGRPEVFPEGVRAILKSGQSITVSGSYTCMRDGAVLAIEDISDKLRTEALRVARDTAVAVARTRSEFLANMSHEIRTPMNAVIGMTGLLGDTPLNNEQREFVETIRSSGSHLLTIINDILDFSKIDAGALEFEHYDFDLRKCVEEAMELTITAASKKGIELLLDIRREVPSQVKGDAGRLRQVLVNLVNNAVKFTEKGEVVVTVDAKPAKDNTHVDIQISVQDTGIGIPQDRMARLFKPFGQVDASSTRRYGGTGLGLVISKQLVERMGGTLEVESTVGRGSTFSFNIVLECVGPAGATPISTDAQILQDKRILIVDDNAVSRRILTGYCEMWGIRSIAVERPAEALSIYRNEPFDLVLLDYDMPGMNGVELAREMMTQRQETPFLILSSIGVPLAEKDSKLFVSRLLKPIRESQLLEQMVAAVQQRDRHIIPKAAPTQVAKLDRGLRVLLVEDNQINQRIAILFLDKLGLTADVVGDGEEAILAVRRQRYDAILMDVQMPRMDGLEATRHICSQYARGERPYIIGMTAHAMTSDRDECFQAGMDDYLQKPVSLAALAAALKKAQERPGRA